MPEEVRHGTHTAASRGLRLSPSIQVLAFPVTMDAGPLPADIDGRLHQLLEQVRGVGADTYRALLGEADEELPTAVVAQGNAAVLASMREAVHAAQRSGAH